MLYGLVMTLHVFVSIGLIVAVLLQSSKGGGLSGTFGGSGVSGGVFGGRGAAPFLTKATTVLAVLFMLTSLSLNYVKRVGRNESVLDRMNIQQPTTSQPVVTDEMPLMQEQSEESVSEEAPAETDSDSK